MHRAKLVEWLLRPFAGKDRAAAMIGDLLETSPSAGRFWVSSLTLLASFTWRPCAALILAYASLSLTWIPAYNGWVVISRHMWVHTGGTIAWASNAKTIEREATLAYLLGCVAQLECVSAVFALVLYGFRDALTVISVVLGCLSVGLGYFLASPPLRTGLLCGFVIAVTFALATNREYRMALAELILAVCASIGLGFLLLLLAATLHMTAVVLVVFAAIPLIDVLAISQLRRIAAAIA